MSTATLDVSAPVSSQQLRQYQTDGYTLVRGLIPRELLEPVRRQLLAIEEGNHDWPDNHFQYFDPDKVRNAKGGKIPGGVQLPATRDESFRAVADHPNLQAAMAQI